MLKAPITIEDYNPIWADTFQELKSIYDLHLADLIEDIQHVGSTSVVGLAAKPIIDIDIIISNDRQSLPSIIKKLSLLGYQHRGSQGITDREAFKRINVKTPWNGSSRSWQAHHLYVCPANSIILKNHLALRDFLRAYPDKAKEYGELKKQLALDNPFDMDTYIERKTPFITTILEKVGFSGIEIDTISSENKASR